MSMFNNSVGATIYGGTFTVTVNNVTNNYLSPQAPHAEQDEASRLLDALTQNNSRGVHGDNLAKRAPGTGIWFVETVLEPWFDGTEKKMWVTGGPGTGKTTLLATAVDDLESRADRTEGMSVGYFYCKHGNKTVTIADVLLVLLRQHLERDSDPSFVALVETALKRHKRENTKFSQSELERLLKAIVQRRPKTIYLLDALDEFPNNLQIELVESLSSLGARLVITSRVSKQLEEAFQEGTTFLEVRAHNEDLDRLLDDRIAHSRKLAAVIGKSDLRTEIADTVKANCNGMFLHAALQIEALRGCRTIGEVRKALADFPREINQFYLDTVKRIMAHPEDTDLAILGLVWLLTSLGPLTIRDLQYALAFDPNASSPFDFAVDPVTQYVGLIHATANEFLADYLKSDPLFVRRHDTLALACISRLESRNFHQSKIQSIGEFKQEMSDHPLLEYADDHCFEHTHKSRESSTREIAIHFISRCETYPIIWGDTLDHFGGIHVAALYGFSEPVQVANQDALCARTPARQLTPLALAASHGHRDVAFTILQSCGEPNLEDAVGVTALIFASFNGHVDVVQLLLDTPGILVNHAEEEGYTALMLASQNGHVNVIRLLLKASGIQVNRPAENGYTALMLASQDGHADAVRLLLASPDVLANHSNKNSFTALMLAAQNGHAEVARLLLNTPGISVNHADQYGFTGLMLASQNGHTAVVRVLLDAPGIMVNHAEEDGWTALVLASQNGHADIVRLLLDAPGILVNHAAKNGLTALMLASKNNHVDVVRLLLAAPGISVNSVEEDGWVALMIASKSGNADVVRLLMDAPGILVNHANANGFTALMLASQNGHVDVVRLLLDAAGISANKSALNGATALLLASKNGHANVVQLLLNAPDILVNRAAKNGLTALMLASQKGHTDVVRLLLDAPGILVNHAEEDGFTALMSASQNGHADIVWLLLNAPGILVNHAEAEDGYTALMLAAQNGHVNVVRLLLDAPWISINQVSAQRSCALAQAAYYGHASVVEDLLGRTEIDVHLADENGDTPLTCALLNEHQGIVQLLQEFVDKHTLRPDAAASAAQTSLVSPSTHLAEKGRASR